MVATEDTARSKESAIASSSTTSSMMTSSLRRLCRICQSESGRLVRPCGCSGTMGDVHEQCLNVWIATSRNEDHCEICQRQYAVDGKRLLPIWKWTQPTFTFNAVVEWVLIAAHIYSCWYMLSLMEERCTVDRLITHALPFRSTDIARIMILTIVLVCLGLSLFNQVFKAVVYVSLQTTRRFANADHHV